MSGHTAGNVPAVQVWIQRGRETFPASPSFPVPVELFGGRVVTPYSQSENFLNAATDTDGAGFVEVLAARGPGVRTNITTLRCVNTGAATVLVTFTAGRNGRVLWRHLVRAGDSEGDHFPVPLAVGDNEDFIAQVSAATDRLYIVATGYKEDPNG